MNMHIPFSTHEEVDFRLKRYSFARIWSDGQNTNSFLMARERFGEDTKLEIDVGAGKILSHGLRTADQREFEESFDKRDFEEGD